MGNLKNEQKKVKMDKNIYDPEKAKGQLMRLYGGGAIFFVVLLLIFCFGGLSEVTELRWLKVFDIVLLLYVLNGYLVMKDTDTVLTETEIGGSPMRTFFFWKPENVVIKFSDIVDASYKVEWGAKDINKFGVGFVNIKSKKGQYKFICSNPGRVSMHVLHKKKTNGI